MTFRLWFFSESVGLFFQSLLSFQHTPKKSLALKRMLCLQIRGREVHRVLLKMKESSLSKAVAPQMFIVFLDKWDLEGSHNL